MCVGSPPTATTIKTKTVDSSGLYYTHFSFVFKGSAHSFHGRTLTLSGVHPWKQFYLYRLKDFLLHPNKVEPQLLWQKVATLEQPDHRSTDTARVSLRAWQRYSGHKYTLSLGDAQRKSRAKLNIGCALCSLFGKPEDRGFAMWVISDLRVSISIHNGTDRAIEGRGFYLLQPSQGLEREPIWPMEFV